MSDSTRAHAPMRRVQKALRKRKLPAVVELRVTTPCKVAWAEMTPVADGVRHCERCDSKVYDLTDMSGRAIVERVRAHGGAMCAQVQARDDGRVVFGDCADNQSNLENIRGGLTLSSSD